MEKRNERKDGVNSMPDYTGLKDFARGVHKLYELHGNVPVFLSVNDVIAPFGIATLQSDVIEGQDAMVFKAYSNAIGKYKKGTVTE